MHVNDTDLARTMATVLAERERYQKPGDVRSMTCMYEIYMWMNVCWHAMYVYDIYIVKC